MEVEISDMPKEEPGKHPLLSRAQYAAQLAGHSLFFQVMSGLSENPVRVVLHDKYSGIQKLLTITLEERLLPQAVIQTAPTPVEKPVVKRVKIVQLPPISQPVPTPTPPPSPRQLTPSPPAPRLNTPGASLAPPRPAAALTPPPTSMFKVPGVKK